MSESAEAKRGHLGRTRPLLSCTLRLCWLESVRVASHFDFTCRRSDRRSSCTRGRSGTRLMWARRVYSRRCHNYRASFARASTGSASSQSRTFGRSASGCGSSSHNTHRSSASSRPRGPLRLPTLAVELKEPVWLRGEGTSGVARGSTAV